MQLILLISLSSMVVTGYRAYVQEKKRQKEHNSKLEENNQQGAINLRNSLISIVMTGMMGLVTAIGVESFKNNHRTPESQTASQNSTKTSSQMLIPNTKHTKYKNVIASKTGREWIPAPGYQFLNYNYNSSDLTVIWKPGKEHPDYPHVVASETERLWNPVPGYEFVTHNNKTDFQVRKLTN